MGCLLNKYDMGIVIPYDMHVDDMSCVDNESRDIVSRANIECVTHTATQSYTTATVTPETVQSPRQLHWRI